VRSVAGKVGPEPDFATLPRLTSKLTISRLCRVVPALIKGQYERLSVCEASIEQDRFGAEILGC
jgi:hypothetical protein